MNVMETTYLKIKEHIIDASYVREYPRALANHQEDTLKLHIKQYTPKQSPRTPRLVTIIGGHANGFPKELYEPFWDELYERCPSAGFDIGSIWIMDAAWQGQSGVLNEEMLGNDPSWFDNSRDILHMINTFRRQMPRPIVGIGHSMGAAQIVHLAGFHPRLFASLVLLDPAITNGNNLRRRTLKSPDFGVATFSSHRRDVWPSRAEAARLFKKSPFYQAWDPRVLELWIKYGLRDCPTALRDAETPAVTLTTTKAQEVMTFLRPNFSGQGRGKPPTDRFTHPDIDWRSHLNFPFYRPEILAIFNELPHLRPPTYYILGKDSNLGTPEQQYERVPHTGIGIGGSGGVEEGRVDYVNLDKTGHLVPMEKPVESAEYAVAWLKGTMEQWWKQEEDFQNYWSTVDGKHKKDIDETWMAHIGPLPGRSKKTKEKL